MEKRLKQEKKEKDLAKKWLSQEREMRLKASELADQENLPATKSPVRGSIFLKQKETENELKQELE